MTMFMLILNIGEEDGEDKWIVHSDSHQKNQNKQVHT